MLSSASRRSAASLPLLRLVVVVGAALYALYATQPPKTTYTSLSASVVGPFQDAEALAPSIGVTKQPDFLFLDKNFLSFTGSFDVFDGLGQAAYAVKGKVISMRKRKALFALDAAGLKIGPPLAYVQKKLIGLRKVYEIYRYEPAYEGQVPVEKDDTPDAPIPLYRYGWVQRGLISLPAATYYYSLDQGEKDPTPVLEAHERFNLNPFTPFMMDVTLPEVKPSPSTTLATIGKATNFHFRRDASWGIEVAKGMDLLGMLTLALSVNEIMEDIEDENRR